MQGGRVKFRNSAWLEPDRETELFTSRLIEEEYRQSDEEDELSRIGWEVLKSEEEVPTSSDNMEDMTFVSYKEIEPEKTEKRASVAILESLIKLPNLEELKLGWCSIIISYSNFKIFLD